MQSKIALEEVTEALTMLLSESGVPKSVRARVSLIMEELRGCADLSVAVNRILNELEDIGNDVNIQPFVRTQIWNISSLLETF